MRRPRRETAAHAVTIPIETDRGWGETRLIGATRVTFATAAAFAAGDPLRFAMTLRGDGPTALDVVCSGSVHAGAAEGELFVVEASIDETEIRLAGGER
jgi:hypothetical protein